jgi:hypothetical protein
MPQGTIVDTTNLLAKLSKECPTYERDGLIHCFYCNCSINAHAEECSWVQAHAIAYGDRHTISTQDVLEAISILFDQFWFMYAEAMANKPDRVRCIDYANNVLSSGAPSCVANVRKYLKFLED